MTYNKRKVGLKILFAALQSVKKKKNPILRMQMG